MKKPSPKRSIFLRPALILVLIGGVIAIAAWTTRSSAAPVEIARAGNEAVPTHLQLYGHVEIAKPTYTAPPTSLPSPTPEVTPPTSTPETMVIAEIITNGYSTSSSSQTADGQAPPAAAAYNGNKYILIDISEQHLYAYESDALVYSFVASTGMYNATRAGTFSVLDKIPNAYGGTWNIWMPNWLGIYWAGSLENGIHALPILPNGAQLWEGYLGTPISYGCVVLGTFESQQLYNWAEVGTPVEIQR